MKLTNGSYYKTADGTVVRVQVEQGGELVAYDAHGMKVHTCGAEDHVNGWEPCGIADYKAARKTAVERPRKKAVKKVKVKTKKE